MSIRKWIRKKKEIQPPAPHRNVRPEHSCSPGTERLEYLEQRSLGFERRIMLSKPPIDTAPIQIHHNTPDLGYPQYDPSFRLHLQSTQAIMMMQYMNDIHNCM